MNRPLVWTVSSFVAGLYAGALGVFPGLAIPSFLCVAFCVFAFLVRERGWARAVNVVGWFFIAGVMVWNARHVGAPGDPLSRYVSANPNVIRAVEGRVRQAGLGVPPREYIPLIVDVDKVWTQSGEMLALQGGVSLFWSEPKTLLFPGDRVRLQGRATLRLGEVNPGIQGPEDYLRRHGVHTRLVLAHPGALTRMAAGPWWSPMRLAARLRTFQAARLAEYIPEDVRSFVFCVWLGDRNLIEQETYRAYIHSGTAHILSVSGLHMGIVFVSVYAFFRVFVRNRRLRALLTMAAVFLFALTAGARIASLRAAVMIALYLTADLFDREPDAPTALSISAFLFLVWNPDNLFDPGFLLSFTSVASLLLFAGRLEPYLRWLPRILREAFAAALSIQILTLPLAIHFFHVLPVAGPLANMIVVPLLAVVLWLSFVTSVTAALVPKLPALFAYALCPAVWLIEGIVDFVGKTLPLHFTLTSPTKVAMVLYWCMAGALTAAAREGAHRSGHRKRYLMTAGAAALFMVLFWRPLFPEAEVTFLDVGHGDAAFVRTESGHTLLVDGGNKDEKRDMGARVVAPFLWSQGVSHLDYVVLSHPHSDHMGGLTYVLEHISVGEVLVSDFPVDSEAQEAFLKLCTQRNVPVRRLHRGEWIDMDGARLEALHPPEAWPAGSTTNDWSLVVRLSWADATVLFTGDVESAAEGALAGLDCEARILKVPHHGSRTSSSLPFVEAVNPTDCVISSAGSYGSQRLDPGVVARYRACNMRVWRTDRHGAVTVKFYRGRAVFKATREERGYLFPTEEMAKGQ